jgi:cytochrome c oxidase cbb3-type subunit I/II
MIRTLVPDVLRYGDYSRLGESIFDHPYQWGSKRTGPDLARVGGKYPRLALRHMENPRSISTGSNMPSYDPRAKDARGAVPLLGCSRRSRRRT